MKTTLTCPYFRFQFRYTQTRIKKCVEMCVLPSNDDIITMINVTNDAVITGLENHTDVSIDLARKREKTEIFDCKPPFSSRYICCLFAFRFLHNRCLSKCCKRWVFSLAVSILCHSVMANYHLLKATKIASVLLCMFIWSTNSRKWSSFAQFHISTEWFYSRIGSLFIGMDTICNIFFFDRFLGTLLFWECELQLQLLSFIFHSHFWFLSKWQYKSEDGKRTIVANPFRHFTNRRTINIYWTNFVWFGRGMKLVWRYRINASDDILPTLFSCILNFVVFSLCMVLCYVWYLASDGKGITIAKGHDPWESTPITFHLLRLDFHRVFACSWQRVNKKEIYPSHSQQIPTSMSTKTANVYRKNNFRINRNC